MPKSACRDCGGPDPCPRCGSCCECYCSEPTFAEMIGTKNEQGMCTGCGGIGECYCGEPG